MSPKSASIPDAWDDDWEAQVDKDDSEPAISHASEPAKKVSSRVTEAQRRAQHELNRQLWAEAESPETFHFLESRSSVPLKSDFKPAVRVLSRKPQIAAEESPPSSIDPSTLRSHQLATTTATIGEDDNGTDAESTKLQRLTLEERQAKAQRDREEKQRKYEEVRERLFGSSATDSATSSPGTTPPPKQHHHHQVGDNKSRGRNRSNGGSREGREKKDSAFASAKSRQLFDPWYATKPNSAYAQKRDMQEMISDYNDEQQPQLQSPSPQPQHPLRSPRGPDGSGRGGSGFGHKRQDY